MNTLNQMTAEVREVNTEKGWRQPGKTYGDYIALLHSEVAEALEALRDAGLEDQTVPDLAGALIKPEGVGSELADILIRYLDTCDVIGLKPYEWMGKRGGAPRDWDPTLDDVEMIDAAEALRLRMIPGPLVSFGDHTSWLDCCITRMWMDMTNASDLLRTLVTVAHKFGIDLDFEYTRKIAFNRTREFRHGGKLL
jgi:NTP pyrophosphatase (non-canonical NTP hydrolase)